PLIEGTEGDLRPRDAVFLIGRQHLVPRGLAVPPGCERVVLTAAAESPLVAHAERGHRRDLAKRGRLQEPLHRLRLVPGDAPAQAKMRAELEHPVGITLHRRSAIPLDGLRGALLDALAALVHIADELLCAGDASLRRTEKPLKR